MPPEENPQEDLALTPANEAADPGTAEQTETPENPAEETPVEAKAEEKSAEQQKPKNPARPFQARIDELTRNWREEERKRQALEAKIAEFEKGKSPSEEAERQPEGQKDYVPANMVEQLADKLADQKSAQRQFDNDCNLAFAKGKAAHPDFEEALQTFGALGGLQRDVVEDAIASGDAHEILYALGKDPDEAVRVLKLPPKMRLAEMIKMANKPAAKPSVSKAAAPIKPVGGTAAKDFDFADDKANDDEWFARRTKAVREAGRV